MTVMAKVQIYLKVVVDLDEGEHPQRLSREICRVVQRVYGVREVEVSNIVQIEEE